MLKTSTVIKFMSIIVMGKVYLPIVFENLPFPLSSYYFISLCWFAALVIFDMKVLLTRSLISVYIFAGFFFAFMAFGIYEPEYKLIIDRVILPLSWSLSIYMYYYTNRDFKGLGFLIGVSLSFIIVTAVTSIVGMNIYPLAARELAGTLALAGHFDVIASYQRIGIAGFGFFSGMAFAFPVLIFTLKTKWEITWKKYLFATGVLIIAYSYFYAQYTMAFLFMVLGSVLAYVSIKNKVISIVIVTVILILLFIVPQTFFLEPLYDLAGYVGSETLQARISDLIVFLETGEVSRDAGTHVGRKAGRVPILLDYIKDNPVFGSGMSLGHNFWLDWVAKYGFVGLIQWVIIIWQQFSFNMKIFDKEYKYYYALSMILFISFGLINNMGWQHMLIIVFLIIPGLFFFRESVRNELKAKQNKDVQYGY